MKYVIKRNEPMAFTDWKNMANDNWQPTYHDLRGNVKCGNLKDDWFDDMLLISPLDPSCEDRFVFLGDGTIRPAATIDAAANETIKRLGLDISKLKDLRIKAIEPFLDESLNEDDMKQFVSGYLKMDTNGMYGEFWTTIRYLFGDFATV